MNNLVIAIDGPAGAGKSTIAKIIAKELKLFQVGNIIEVCHVKSREVEFGKIIKLIPGNFHSGCCIQYIKDKENSFQWAFINKYFWDAWYNVKEKQDLDYVIHKRGTNAIRKSKTI